MSDHRNRPRLPIKINVDFTSHDSALRVLSLNISAGGIYLATYNPLPPGSTVVLHLHLPTLDSAVEVLGEVVWNNIHPEANSGLPEGMGIRFLNMSSLAQRHLGLFQTGRIGNS